MVLRKVPDTDVHTAAMKRRSQVYRAKANCQLGKWLGCIRLSEREWLVLLCLDKYGDQMLSNITVAGAHVQRPVAVELVSKGLVKFRGEKPATWACLTPEGDAALRLVEHKRLKGKP